jgi:hypothetical protein
MTAYHLYTVKVGYNMAMLKLQSTFLLHYTLNAKLIVVTWATTQNNPLGGLTGSCNYCHQSRSFVKPQTVTAVKTSYLKSVNICRAFI